MKKILAFLLTLSLLLTAASALADVDLSYVENKPTIYEIYGDDSVLSVRTVLSAGDLSFVHAYESDYRYSFSYFELWVMGGSDVIYPVLNVIYSADNPQHIHAISFDVDGTRYTFDVDEDEPEVYDDGIAEWCMIFLGPESFDFLVALEDITDICENADQMMEHRITAVLHGDEDLTVTLSDSFLVDFYLIIEDAYMELGGLETFDELDEVANDMTTSEAPAPEAGTGADDITEKLREMFHK